MCIRDSDYTVMVKGTVLASGPTDTTFTAENLELAFSGVLRHVTLNGSEESLSLIHILYN